MDDTIYTGDKELLDKDMPPTQSEIKTRSTIGKSNNANGNRGEAIAIVRLTEGNLFRIYFLGEKAPTVDFLLEVAEYKCRYFALVQVKSTARDQQKKDRLTVELTNDDRIRIESNPFPTYLVGVDVEKEIVYFTPVFDTTNLKYTAHMPTKYRLKFGCKKTNAKNLQALINDIKAFSDDIAPHKHNYKSKL